MDAKAIEARFVVLVKEQIADDKTHGWGAEDSAMVIERLIDDCIVGAKEPAKQVGLVMPYVKRVLNPSQYRQKLEHGGALTASEKKKREKNALSAYV